MVVLEYEYWAVIYLVQQISRVSSSTESPGPELDSRMTRSPKILIHILMNASKQQYQVQTARKGTREACKR